MGIQPANLRVKLLILLTAISVCFVALTSYAKYIYAKDYYFYLESPCDQDGTICYQRDCDDYCPPNELDVYQIYTIAAYNFADCSDNACTNICSNPSDERCAVVECDPTSEDNDCTE